MVYFILYYFIVAFLMFTGTYRDKDWENDLFKLTMYCFLWPYTLTTSIIDLIRGAELEEEDEWLRIPAAIACFTVLVILYGLGIIMLL